MKKIHPLYDVTTDEKNRCEERRYIIYYQEVYGLSCMIYVYTIYRYDSWKSTNWTFLNLPKENLR